MRTNPLWILCMSKVSCGKKKKLCTACFKYHNFAVLMKHTREQTCTWVCVCVGWSWSQRGNLSSGRIWGDAAEYTQHLWKQRPRSLWSHKAGWPLARSFKVQMRNRCPFSARSQIANGSHGASKLDKRALTLTLALFWLAISLVVSGRIYDAGTAW